MSDFEISNPQDDDTCVCGYVFPAVLSITVKPETITRLDAFVVVSECPKCGEQYVETFDVAGRAPEPLGPHLAARRKDRPS